MAEFKEFTDDPIVDKTQANHESSIYRNLMNLDKGQRLLNDDSIDPLGFDLWHRLS